MGENTLKVSVPELNKSIFLIHHSYLNGLVFTVEASLCHHHSDDRAEGIIL